MIITKTPYRLSLFGGGTDYRPWFEEKGGVIITSAMARYCYLSIRRLPPFFNYKTRVVYSKMEIVNTPDEILHPAVKHCLKFMNIQDGLEIHHDGDLPARSGIGSSSSFTVGLLHALHALKYEMVTQKTLADEAIHVEHDLMGEHVGIQDQIIAAFGGLRVIEMGPGNAYKVTPLILPPDYLRAFEDHILLGFTGISRISSTIAETHIRNIRDGSSTDHLEAIQTLASEALDLFKKNEDFEKIGALLHRSWLSKRRFSQDITTEAIDDLFETARKAGAFGGKLMGAGGGGFVFFLAPPERRQAIKDALPSIRVWVPFQIEMAGSEIVFHSDLTHGV
mgnify:CR=1 FL=1